MSNDKPRMVEVTGDELAEIMAHPDRLEVPHLVSDLVKRSGPSKLYADADELRAWRELRSQDTSGVPE